MPSPAVRWTAYTAVLYASFAHNVFWVPDGTLGYGPGFRLGYLGYDSDLVLNRMKAAADGAAWWHPLVAAADGRPSWYRSQCGVQGMVVAAAYRVVGGSVSGFGAVAAAGMALLTAGLLAAFFADVARRASPAAGAAGVALTACTPVLLPFATSLYWVVPLALAPFLAAWFLLPTGPAPAGRLALTAVLVGVLVALKALCGYEYLSTVVLAPAAAAVYHCRAGGGGWRSVALPAAVVTAAGVVGAAGAMAVHATQLAALDGGGGVSLIRERATTMTRGATLDPARCSLCLAPDPVFLPSPVRLHARHVLNCFWLPAAGTPTTWGPARAAAPLGVVVAAAALAGWVVRGRGPAAAALAPAAAVGLVAGVSWYALARTHTCTHAPYNLFAVCVPFLPRANARIGAALGGRFSSAGWAEGVLAVGAVAVVGGNLALGFGADEPDAARVTADVRAGRVGPAVPAILNEYRLGFRPADLRSAPWANCRAVADLEDRGGPTRVLAGWLVSPPTWAGGPVGRVVAVKGGQVIPADVVYERVSVIERQLGGGVTCTLFRAAVPDDPADPVRLYSVDPDGRAAELVPLAVSPAAGPAALPAGP